MNTENSKIRFKLDLKDKVNLKNPNKNMALANLSIYYTWKKSQYNNRNLIFQHQLGMILLIYLMVLILLQIFRTTLNLSPKNMKVQPKIHQFKVIQIKSKTELFLKKNWV